MIADELERYFQQRADRDAFSGVVLITQGSSQLFAGTYGYASRSWKAPNRLTTRFDTASVTKLFTAVATLQLIDKGVLAFDTTVVESLGLWDTAISRGVNVYHLLTHTSGIADDAEEERGGVRRSLQDHSQLWGYRDRRLSPTVRVQATEFPARPGRNRQELWISAPG